MRIQPRAGQRLIALASLALFTYACADDQPTAPLPESPNFAVASRAPEATNNHVVQLSDGIPADLAARVAALGGSVLRTHPEINLALVSGLGDAQATDLENSAGVERVTRDFMVPWTPSPDEFSSQDGEVAGHDGVPTAAFFFPCQWNLSQIDCPTAWAKDQFGDPNVKVAVLDTGTDPNHQDLAGRIDVANSVSMLSTPSICDLFAPDVGTFFDFNFHGTFVSGIITSNGIGVAGVAPLTQVVGVKVLNCLGSGSFGDVIAGILYAASLSDVDVINMSLGAYFPKNLPGAGPLVGALNKAVNFAGSQGVLVVSAAGNSAADLDRDKNFTSVPAQSGSGISIWAGDIDGGLASYSNSGRSGTWVGAGGGDNTPGSPSVPLPGCLLPTFGHDGIVSVCSTFSLFFGCGPGSYLFNGSGTSFSAPAVSGVAALLDGKHGGALNGGQLRSRLAQTADDLGKKGVDRTFSHGRVNAGNAVNK